MSPQQTIEMRQQMIRETEDFLERELNSRDTASQNYPSMQFQPPAFDDFSRRSFVTTSSVTPSKYPRN